MSTEADEEQLRIALAVLFRRHAVDGVLTVFDTEIEDDDDESTFIVESLKDGVRVTLVPAFVKTGLEVETVGDITTDGTSYTYKYDLSNATTSDSSNVSLHGKDGAIYIAAPDTTTSWPTTSFTGTWKADGTFKIDPEPFEVK